MINAKQRQRTSTAQKWTVVLLFWGMFISALDRGSLAAAIPEIMKDFKFDPAVMGVALSAFFWSYAVCNLPAGNAADRFGSKTVLGWAAAIWSLTSAATGLVRNSFGLVMARVGVGAAEAATYPVCAKIVAETFPSKERATAIGWYLSGARLGLAATPLVISFLIARWSWRTAFIITGLLGLSWCAVWYLGFHDASRRPSVGAAPPNLVIPWRKLLGNRCALGLFIAKFLQDYVYFMFITWLPAYLMLERGFSQTQTGVYASLPFFAAFIAQPLVGHTSDWLIRRGVSVTKARKFTLLGCQICTATVIAVGFVANPMAAVVLLVINVAGEAGIGGMMFAIGAEVSPPQMAGSFLGAMNTVGAASGILAPILTGFIVKTSGSFRIALAVGSCFIVIAAFSIFFVVQEIKPLELCERSSSAVQT